MVDHNGGDADDEGDGRPRGGERKASDGEGSAPEKEEGEEPDLTFILEEFIDERNPGMGKQVCKYDRLFSFLTGAFEHRPTPNGSG